MLAVSKAIIFVCSIPVLKMLYKTMVTGKKLTGKEPQALSEMSFLSVIEFLGKNKFVNLKIFVLR